MQKINVINFHCTDRCNFSCKHCFVKKECKEVKFEDAKKCVDKISEYFILNNINNGRINLAGGESLLYPNLDRLIDYIHSKNIRISIITNGSLIKKDFIELIKNRVDMIGISVDSLSSKINSKIGRGTCQLLPDENFYLEKCQIIKNSGIKLKINICVSKLNIKSNFQNFLEIVKPDRLKILQMVVQENVNNKIKDLQVSEKEFNNFINKYKEFNPIIENKEDIEQSYLILDSNCCISTSNDHSSKYSLLKTSLSKILNKIKLDQLKFNKRYNKSEIKSIIK